jgi:hypothetical protein
LGEFEKDEACEEEGFLAYENHKIAAFLPDNKV